MPTMPNYQQFTGADPIPHETGTQLFNIEGDFGRDVSIEVYQAYPLPFEVTAVAPSWTLGE